jgi:hypothetical protein
MESLFYKKLLNITNNCIMDHISLKQILFRFFCGGGTKKKKKTGVKLANNKRFFSYFFPHKCNNDLIGNSGSNRGMTGR